jgi:hypothetical protein
MTTLSIITKGNTSVVQKEQDDKGRFPWLQTPNMDRLAGDVASDGSFEQFPSAVLTDSLKVTGDKVDYRFGATDNHLEVTRYDPKAPERFSLPLINGQPVNLHPPATYESPYLNGAFGSDKITVTVGPFKRLLDFSK